MLCRQYIVMSCVPRPEYSEMEFNCILAVMRNSSKVAYYILYTSIPLCTVFWILRTLILWCIYEMMILYLSAVTQVATYKGVESSAPLIQWFWQVMEEFSNVERSLFLRFVWGRTRLPRTVADFRGRDFVLQVTMNYHNSVYHIWLFKLLFPVEIKVLSRLLAVSHDCFSHKKSLNKLLTTVINIHQ